MGMPMTVAVITGDKAFKKHFEKMFKNLPYMWIGADKAKDLDKHRDQLKSIKTVITKKGEGYEEQLKESGALPDNTRFLIVEESVKTRVEEMQHEQKSQLEMPFS